MIFYLILEQDQLPGLITITLSLLTPLLIAKFLVYSELAITFSTLLKTLITLLFKELPLDD